MMIFDQFGQTLTKHTRRYVAKGFVQIGQKGQFSGQESLCKRLSTQGGMHG